MEGALTEGVLPLVLRTLYVGRKTGLLHVTRGEERGSVCFVQGSTPRRTSSWERSMRAEGPRGWRRRRTSAPRSTGSAGHPRGRRGRRAEVTRAARALQQEVLSAVYGRPVPGRLAHVVGGTPQRSGGSGRAAFRS